jgi:putative ABC transport system permease protein
MGFAVVMVLLQLGFLHAVELTARVPYDPLAFDVLLVSPQFDQFYDPGAFPRARLAQAAAIETVVAARPLWARMDLWRCPTPPPLPPPPRAVGGGADPKAPHPDPAAGPTVPIHWRALLLIGVDLSDNPYVGPIREAIDAHATRLRLPGRVLLDELSNPDFGLSRVGDFKGWELAGHRAVVVGGFRLGRSFGADAAVLGSEQTFARGLASVVRPGASDSASLVNFGLLQIRSGTLAETLDALRRRLPPDVRALSRAEVYRLESHHWVQRTATGMIFSFGVGVTMLVAAVVVYQVLSNDVRNRLPEYATLKAIGYTDAGLAGIVVAQAAIYALLAFVPAALVSIVT